MPNLPVDVDSWGRSACYPRSTFYPLSDGRSTPGRRITRAWFPTCSACGPRSRACLCSCTQEDGCRPSRADLCAPPVLFRRRPPQSNCPPGTVHDFSKLGPRIIRGGSPTLTPRTLACKPGFPPARPVGLAVEPAYALALKRTVAARPEQTFARLRYSLGGDRPSQTTQLARSPIRMKAWG